VLLYRPERFGREGVGHNSSFPTPAHTPIHPPGLAAFTPVSGGPRPPEAMIEGVNRRHGSVTGLTAEGKPYRADDPILLDWVQATAAFGFMEAYHRYARPLSDEARNRFLAEGKAAADLYGATNAPVSVSEMNMLFDVMRPRLVKTEIVFEFLNIVGKVPALPAALRPFQKLLITAAVELLPGWVRDRLGLRQSWSLTPMQRALVKAAAFGAERIMLPSSAPVQACRRLGLPDTYLYRQRP
ncbi:MAG: oxygenase MpaB family protein, partial [Hydrogenophaga sp.]|nr:oxygenase MpaB family protein [Hydrogenophaga sp.]